MVGTAMMKLELQATEVTLKILQEMGLAKEQKPGLRGQLLREVTGIEQDAKLLIQETRTALAILQELLGKAQQLKSLAQTKAEALRRERS